MTRAAEVEGYTVLRCSAPGCATSEWAASLAAEALAVLRGCVRSSQGGVLVSTGCTLGTDACRLRPSGPVLLVQPCNASREPTCPAVRVGPLRTEADVTAVHDWLRAGDLHPAQLPAHLTLLHRAVQAAPTN